MNVAPWELWLLLAIVVATFVIDGLIVDRRPREFGFREATRWVLIYIGAAAIFAVWVWQRHGVVAGEQFVAAYLTEYSLSVDNLFVFLVLMQTFAVPAEQRHRVLRIGVALSLILRGVLIVLGAAAVQRFSATLFVFAALLLWTAVSVWRSGESENSDNQDESRIIGFLERILPVTRTYEGSRFVTKVSGRRHATPLLLVVLALGVTNVLFAVDSIPAVFGLTSDAYIIFSSNAFALMGLRQIFFMLHGLMGRLRHMAKGLSFILGFIAIKLVLEACVETFDMDIFTFNTWQSLVVIVVALTVTVIASLVTSRHSGPKADGGQ